jgi:serine/threonine-protein kinase
MFCSRCGTEVQQASQFCPTCGLDLRASAPVPAIGAADVSELDLVREAMAAEYELVEELGRGGMAVVYRARETHLEREVAVKVLPFSLAFDADFVERFTREARTAAQLEHPNIIPIYRVGKQGRVIYFVMKYLRGGSLSRVMHERKKLDPPEIRKLLIDVGSALGYAHKRGIVHRDVKPDNVMFDEHGLCIVTDFGIAKAGTKSRLTGTGMAIGTPHYMSPEQARAQEIDGRSDLYSLGIVAYQAMVGELPYDGEDSFAIGYKHIMEPIPVPLLDTPDERRLFEVIKRLMMKDPYDRFQSAEDLVASLSGQPQAPMFASQASVSTGRRLSQAQAAMAVQSTTPLPAFQTPRSPLPPTPPVSPRPSQALEVDTPKRPVMRRSVAAPAPARSGGWVQWFLVLLVLGGFVGGGWYLYKEGLLGGTGAAPEAPVQPDSVPGEGDDGFSALPPVLDSAAGDADLTPDPRPVTQPPAAAALPPAQPAAAAVQDSGVLLLRGLPAGSQVMIDGAQLTQASSRIPLPAGGHEVGILARGYPFFTDSVTILAGQVLTYTPNLGTAPRALIATDSAVQAWRRTLAALDCDNPKPANRYGARCYDQRPLLQSNRVPIPPGVNGIPVPVRLIVKVSSQGKTLAIKTPPASGDPLFIRAVEAFALGVKWTPAQRAGEPVDGWTQVIFQPDVP